MPTCSNCNKTLSCGCQRRVASDGAQVCSTCVISYEATVKNKPVVKPTTNILYQKK